LVTQLNAILDRSNNEFGNAIIGGFVSPLDPREKQVREEIIALLEEENLMMLTVIMNFNLSIKQLLDLE